ncbi:MAG: terpene cyclase/mutase family protein [Planctomycetales bacterium]|nr:terpene cyclase/mutase family protein [Planctomycetales bacterium]
MRNLTRHIRSYFRLLPSALCLSISAFCLLPSAFGQDSARSLTAAPLTEAKVVERVTVALDRSLKYLSDKQQPDGSWHTNQAVNGLSLLAFMGRGHVPGRGPYADKLDAGKKFILRKQTDAGIFASPTPSHGPMYEHALATLAMVEMYGADPDPVLEEKLRKAVDLIVKAQSPSGGWRYAATPGDQDLSVTVMQIVALRAANNAEIPVPQTVIDKAIAYVKSCAVPTGGFGYQGSGGMSPQVSAAGVISLQLLGKYDDPSIPKTLEYLNKIPVQWNSSGPSYFYYFHYYAIQAQYQAGGKSWNDWHPRVRELLLEKQNSDGSWDVPPGTAENAGVIGPNKVYWTAMASLILEIYMHFLPAYQR